MGGLGTDGRGGSAVGPSSSVCALVVLSRGIRYAWVACRHCLREAGRRPWVGVIWLLCVGGVSSLSKGGALLSMGGSRLVVVSGRGVVVVGAGSLLVARGC